MNTLVVSIVNRSIIKNIPHLDKLEKFFSSIKDVTCMNISMGSKSDVNQENTIVGSTGFDKLIAQCRNNKYDLVVVYYNGYGASFQDEVLLGKFKEEIRDDYDGYITLSILLENIKDNGKSKSCNASFVLFLECGLIHFKGEMYDNNLCRGRDNCWIGYVTKFGRAVAAGDSIIENFIKIMSTKDFRDLDNLWRKLSLIHNEKSMYFALLWNMLHGTRDVSEDFNKVFLRK